MRKISTTTAPLFPGLCLPHIGLCGFYNYNKSVFIGHIENRPGSVVRKISVIIVPGGNNFGSDCGRFRRLSAAMTVVFLTV